MEQKVQLYGISSLQKESFVVLSDSGTLSEESAMLNFPGVLIRTSTERPEALDSGTIVIGGITTNNITQGIKMAVQLNGENILLNKDYLSIGVSIKVLKLIQSYTSIINITTWKN